MSSAVKLIRRSPVAGATRGWPALWQRRRALFAGEGPGSLGVVILRCKVLRLDGPRGGTGHGAATGCAGTKTTDVAGFSVTHLAAVRHDVEFPILPRDGRVRGIVERDPSPRRRCV